MTPPSMDCIEIELNLWNEVIGILNDSPLLYVSNNKWNITEVKFPKSYSGSKIKKLIVTFEVEE